MNAILLTVGGAVSGGILYPTTLDFYHIYISKTHKSSRPFTLQLLLNPGLFIGAGIGFSRYYLGKPLFDIYLK